MTARTTEVETYLLGLVVGELGELQAEIGNALRFGLNTPTKTGEAQNRAIAREIGDVLAAIHLLQQHVLKLKDFSGGQMQQKLQRLTATDAKDNLGRPLVPSFTE